jgi:hypothetical protein
METMVQFTGLMVTTLFAAGLAMTLNWLLLRAMFQVMRPATQGQLRIARTDSITSARELAHEFAMRSQR